jgi:hypothetical protein
MMRRCVNTSLIAAVGSSVRNMIVYSESNAVLTNNQKARGSQYNAWIEEWELPRLSLVPLATDPHPTVVVMDKCLELMNMSCVTNAPESLLEAPTHSSWQTHKPYGAALQFQLQNEAQTRGYTSKWWLTRQACKSQGLTLRSGTRDVKVSTKGKLSLFHASQFADPMVVQHCPVSGVTRKTYAKNGDSYRLLRQAALDNNYSSGLFFSRRQLELYGLAPKSDAVPVTHSVAMSETFKFFNLDQMENPEAICEALGRNPVNAPTFLLSGEPIRVPVPPSNFKSNYYLSGRDAELYDFKILPSERTKGVLLTEKSIARSEVVVELFNADQLTDVKRAFEVAGSLAKL